MRIPPVPYWVSFIAVGLSATAAVTAACGSEISMRWGSTAGWAALMLLYLDEAKRDLDRRYKALTGKEYKEPLP